MSEYGRELPNLPQPQDKPTHRPETPAGGGGRKPRKRKKGAGSSGFRAGRRRRSLLAKWIKALFGGFGGSGSRKHALSFGKARAKSFRNHGFTGSGRGGQTGFKGMERKR